MSGSDLDRDAGFDRVIGFVDDRLAFEPGFYNDDYLERRVTARIRRREATDYAEYLAILEADPEERAALLDSLTINVTGFFRNPEVWEALRPVVRDLTADGRARAWSAPCADGREAYSLAMLARDDPEIRARRLRVLGTDIDEEALSAAREGVYETTGTTDIGAELEPLSEPTEYVDREGDRFAVREAVKRSVGFERHDLIRDDPKEGVDLAFCRNLLIYIASDYKRQIFDTVVSSLRPGGYLVLGTTETPPRSYRGLLDPVDKNRRIYRRD